jgi:nucleotide-binding universal stress UspA family protein
MKNISDFNPSKILIPTDFSEVSKLAIEQGAMIAKANDATLYVLHIAQELTMLSSLLGGSDSKEKLAAADATLKASLEELGAEIKNTYSIAVKTIFKHGNPKKEIIETAKEIEAGLIVMGTHGYGRLEELLIGSNTLKVITNAPCPIISTSVKVKNPKFERILLPIDTSLHARQKVKFAVQFAKKFNSTIHAVVLLTPSESHHEASMNVMLNQIKKFAANEQVKVVTEVKREVVNRAQTTMDLSFSLNVDLLVITADQDAELSSIYLGPYKQQILHVSKVPVVTINPKDLSESTNLIMFGT